MPVRRESSAQDAGLRAHAARARSQPRSPCLDAAECASILEESASLAPAPPAASVSDGPLGYQLTNDLAADVRQAELTPLVAIGQFRVVNPQLMQQGGVQVVNVDRLGDRVVAKLVCFTVRQSRLHAAAGKPDCEAARMVVASVSLFGHHSLAVDGAPEFAAPDYERFVEQPATVQDFNERRRGLVRIGALFRKLLGQRTVLVPSAMEELDEAHATLHEPSGD